MPTRPIMSAPQGVRSSQLFPQEGQTMRTDTRIRSNSSSAQTSTRDPMGDVCTPITHNTSSPSLPVASESSTVSLTSHQSSGSHLSPMPSKSSTLSFESNSSRGSFSRMPSILSTVSEVDEEDSSFELDDNDVARLDVPQPRSTRPSNLAGIPRSPTTRQLERPVSPPLRRGFRTDCFGSLASVPVVVSNRLEALGLGIDDDGESSSRSGSLERAASHHDIRDNKDKSALFLSPQCSRPAEGFDGKRGKSMHSSVSQPNLSMSD